MSLQRYETGDGIRWRVRWRDRNGHMHSRSFLSKREAQGFDVDVKARKFRGEVLPRPGRQTLAGAFAEWDRLIAPQKAENTRRNYRALWNAHIKNRFDHHLLSDLSDDPQLIDELRADMERRGVGRAAQRKTLIVLSAVLTQCVRWKKIATNPVRGAPKPSAARMRASRPLPPLVVERIRLEVKGRDSKDKQGHRPAGDALLVSLMAYAGLRPQEALALRFGDVKSKTLIVDKALAFGEEKETKTGEQRVVPLAEPLADDLRAWRVAQNRPGDNALVFPGPEGRPWSHSAYNNWRSRVWKPAVKGVANRDEALQPLATTRPYDCRGSFVSLHLRAGEDPLLVAKWAGHSPAVMWRHYASFIEELTGEPRVSAERQIVNARRVLKDSPADEVQKLVAESMKPMSEVSDMLAEKLFAPRTRGLH